MSNEVKHIGDAISHAMDQSLISLDSLAEQTGLSKQVILKIISGDSEGMQVAELLGAISAIAEVLELEPQSFFVSASEEGDEGVDNIQEAKSFVNLLNLQKDYNDASFPTWVESPRFDVISEGFIHIGKALELVYCTPKECSDDYGKVKDAARLKSVLVPLVSCALSAVWKEVGEGYSDLDINFFAREFSVSLKTQDPINVILTDIGRNLIDYESGEYLVGDLKRLLVTLDWSVDQLAKDLNDYLLQTKNASFTHVAGKYGDVR